VTHQTSRNHLLPAGRPPPADGREAVRPSQVSWFGWNGRFLVPTMHSISAGGPAGSRITKGNRRSRREASLNRTAQPRDHGMIRGLGTPTLISFPAAKNPADGTKKGLTANTVAMGSSLRMTITLVSLLGATEPGRQEASGMCSSAACRRIPSLRLRSLLPQAFVDGNP